MDRIATILEGHLKFARQQLQLMRHGAKFDGLAGLSSTESHGSRRLGARGPGVASRNGSVNPGRDVGWPNDVRADRRHAGIEPPC